MNVGILGYGYTASFLAQLLTAQGHTVWGTSRDPDALKYEVPTHADILPFEKVAVQKALATTSCLVISTPPSDSDVDRSLDWVFETVTSNTCNFQWIGYLSSTGVYGDHQGQWVDETSACHATTPRAQRRLQAENAWISLCASHNCPVMIFRLAGIYGPARNAIERLQQGEHRVVVKPGQFFSRIHVYDICAALYQSMLAPMPGEIFNLADDLPCNSLDVSTYAAELLQIEMPEVIPYGAANLSKMAQEFYASNRRVSNAKLKRDLLPVLRYPTYKEGLKAIFDAEPIV